MNTLRALGTALLIAAAGPAPGIETTTAEVQAFVDRLVAKHDFDRDELLATLGSAQRQDNILKTIRRPAERTLSWGEYRKIFVNADRIAAGRRFWHEHAEPLKAIADDTGVPVAILVGIIGVESYFGRTTGNYRVIDALATLAFHYPRRAAFFTRELEAFLLLARDEDLDVSRPTGSYAGAMGRPQFMPSSYLAYAVDATGDGKRDIWNDWTDVAGSIANYFTAHRWRPGEEVIARATLAASFAGPVPKATLRPSATLGSLNRDGVRFATTLPADAIGHLFELKGDGAVEHWVAFHNFFVITRYNRSIMYALAVHQLGHAIASGVPADAG